MAVSFGYQGIVTSWAGTANALLLGSTSKTGEHTANLNITSGPHDRTQYAASLESMSSGPGLADWSATIEARHMTGTSPVAQVGYLGNVTVSSATDTYVTNVRAWNATISAIEMETTAYGSPASAGWKSFAPGLIKIAGTYEAIVDGTTVLETPYLPGTTLPTLTLTLSTSNTLAFLANVYQLSAVIPVAGLNVATYGFESVGNITAANDADSSNIFATGTIVKPVAGSLVFAATSGARTYTGDAFWTSIGIAHQPDDYVNLSIGVRGTGALTIG